MTGHQEASREPIPGMTYVRVADNGEITVNNWPSPETGPCTKCGQPWHVYGAGGSPLCEICDPAADTRAGLPPMAWVPSPRHGWQATEPEREAELTLF